VRRETFFSFRNYLWFWVCFATVILLSAYYLLNQPVGGHRGSTYYGYTVGTISALAIVFLMWFGIRKRSYTAHRASLKAWLSAHIWIGISLLIIVPLHAGFQFGFNIHSLAFFLMAAVILSGFVGVYFYSVLPEETLSNRGGGSLSNSYKAYETTLEEIKKQVNKNPQFESIAKKCMNFSITPDLKLLFGCRTKELSPELIQSALGSYKGQITDDMSKLISDITKSRDIMIKIENERSVLFRLKVWLLFHVPISLALVLAVIFHIFGVFYYWS